MQLCDDTLVDPRVNATACSDLGIRSIAVQPILDGGELWGLLEVFSLVPHAFSDSDLQELQGLSRKISANGARGDGCGTGGASRGRHFPAAGD